MTQETLSNIPSNILDFAGITPQILDQIKEEDEEDKKLERAELLNNLGQGEKEGHKLYGQRHTDIRNNCATPFVIPGNTETTIKIDREISSVPDQIVEAWYSQRQRQQFLDANDPELQQATNQFVRFTIKGYGDEAFMHRDWQTSVNAADIITEGGVLHSDYLRKKIEALNLNSQDYSQRISIAKAIQARIQKTEPSASS